MNIPFQSVLTNIKDIKERNKAFDELSDEDKRKEIAFDSLGLILVEESMQAKGGDYWGTLEGAVKQTETSEELQNFLLTAPKCEVCARGAIMMSQIRLGNSIGLKNNYYYDIEKGANQRLLKGFTVDTMDNMEQEFEGWVKAEPGNPWGDRVQIKDYESGCRQPYASGSNEKLVNILCNIITNGDFVPEDDTDYLTKYSIEL